METVNQEINVTETEEKTFTQAEVDKIVGERLGRERAKYADFDAFKEKAEKFDEIQEQSKSELQKALEKSEALQKELDDIKAREQVRGIRESVANETSVPASLLTGTTEEECKAQAEAIKAYANPSYPSVKDAGEPKRVMGGKGTREMFAEWFEEANG